MPVSRPTDRRRRPGRAGSLSTETIVAVALRLARAEGLAAVTMRRIADELDTGPMSLYRYVADRQALLLRMLDEVAAAVVAVPVPDGTPRERITAIMAAMHDGFRNETWLVPVIAVEGLASPRILPLVDGLFGALLDAGLTEPQAVEGYALLFHFTYGEAIDRHREQQTFGRQMVRAADPVEFPHIGRILASMPAASGRDFYAANLDRLLDGLLEPRSG